MPRRVKYRKIMRERGGRSKGIATSKTELAFGSFGLKAQTNAWITSRQIEASRRAMTRSVKKGGKIWIRIFPDKSVTLKGSEVRMGGGKGAVDHYVAVIKRGTIMFEMGGIDREVAKTALKLAAYKLPVRTIFIEK